MNKKGKKLMDDVEKLWRDRNRQSERLQKFGADASSFLEKITGESTGEAPRDRVAYQKRKMKGFMEKRGMFGGDTTATPAQVMLKKKKDAKRAVGEAKRLEKRQRGSKTLKKRKSEVPAYLQKLEELKKYKKGFQLIWLHFAKKHYEDWARNPAAYSNGSSEEIYEKLQSLGLIK